ncbi:Phage-related lysozyme (muraminidase) [Providencia stuartii]|nr:Phage-related lysozyme (muraminidase) [Providencia stuartii]
MDEILGHLTGESTGSYLLGRNGMWHSGIHMTNTTTPWCALSSNKFEEQTAFPIKYTGDQPIQCMADGEIVAYRINQDYIPIQWGGMTLQLSGSFVLVRHEVQLGETQSSGLRFYTLYMHLAPHLAYQKSGLQLWELKNTLNAYSSEWKGTPNPARETSLPSGTIVEWDNQTRMTVEVNREKREYGLVTLKSDDGTVKKYWILVDKNNVQLKKGDITPSWWKSVLSIPTKEHAQFDKVMCPSSPIPIRAGDSIGHMGFYQAPKERGFESRYQVHIECFSDDDNLPLFLQNKEAIDRDTPRYLKCSPGLMLWTQSVDEPDMFVRSERVATHESIYTLSKLDIKQDKYKNKYYYLPEYLAYLPIRLDFGALTYLDLKEEDKNLKQFSRLLSQYDLAQLGFKTVVNETNTFDYLPGLGTINAPFISSIFKEIIEKVELSSRPNKAIIAFNYNRLLLQMTSSQTIDYNPNEYRYMFHHPMFADVINKTIVKHPSDWYYTAKDAIWQPFLQYLAKDAPQWKAYSEEFIENMTWMQAVTKDKLVPSLWHMHPLVFLDAIKTEKTHNVIFPLRVKPKNDKDGIWKNYYWAASLTDKNASQAIFGRNRYTHKGNTTITRKHAARDLYTEPKEEVIAICNGVVKSISHYYNGTWQITIEHKTVDGREFIVRYGEVDKKSILVNVDDNVSLGDTIAKTGFLVDLRTNKHLSIIPNEIVYMLHFEFYTDVTLGEPPNNTGAKEPPFHRRGDLVDPLGILQEGYNNTFETINSIKRININILTLSESGKEFIKAWEGFEQFAYNDSKGYCTIGYGHLIEMKKCEDIILDDEFSNGITQEKANELFEERLPLYIAGVKNSITVDLYQYEFDALVSLLFNIGASGLDSKAPKLKEKINNEDYDGAAIELLDITNGGILGLVKRRESENKLFLNNVYKTDH